MTLCVHHTIAAIVKIMAMERIGWIEQGSMRLQLLDKEVALA